MLEQELRVKTLRMSGLLSPTRSKFSDQFHLLNQEPITLSGHHVGYLNDRINIRFREDTFATSTLDIEAEDP